MSLVSLFLIGLFAVSCGISAYKKLFSRVLIAYMTFSYFAIVFYGLKDPMKFLFYDGITIFFLILILLIFILRKKISSNYKKIILLFFSWTISSRCLGIPNALDFGEKGLGLFVVSGFNITFFLWSLFFLFFHRKRYQKICLVFFSILQVALFAIFKISFEPDFMLIAIPFFYIILCLSFITAPLTFIFAHLGELLLFLLLCYEVFFEDFKGSRTGGSQNQGHQAQEPHAQEPHTQACSPKES